LREARRRRDLLAALRQPYESGARPLDGLDQLEAALRAEHGDDLRQAVGRRAVARHDGRAHAAEEANARFRIDNVRIALAVDLDVLVGVAGGGDRAVAQDQARAGLALDLQQRADGDLPAVLARWRPANHDVAAAGHEGTRNAV